MNASSGVATLKHYNKHVLTFFLNFKFLKHFFFHCKFRQPQIKTAFVPQAFPKHSELVFIHIHEVYNTVFEILVLTESQVKDLNLDYTNSQI